MSKSGGLVKRGPGVRSRTRLSDKERAALDDFREALCRATAEPTGNSPCGDSPKMFGSQALASEKSQLNNPVLAERAATYGDFGQQCQIIAGIESVVHASPGWAKMAPTMREAMGQIITKMGRLCNGDPAHKDSWVDIAGYAELQVLRMGATHSKVNYSSARAEELQARRMGSTPAQYAEPTDEEIEARAKKLLDDYSSSIGDILHTSFHTSVWHFQPPERKDEWRRRAKTELINERLKK